MAQAGQNNSLGNVQLGELNESDRIQYIEELIRTERTRQRQQHVEVAPTTGQQLSGRTIFCLILNRTIGTGIFAQLSNVLFLTGSPVIAVLLWIAGGLIIVAITFGWLELGLSVPREHIRSQGASFWFARSGGDKNYLEYIYKRPKQWMSCVFGITFITFGNLAGNAIQFGVYMQLIISPQCPEGTACFNTAAMILWALFILTLCSFINICTRKIFIGLNDAFAFVKLVFVIVVAFLGIIYGFAHDEGCKTNLAWSNRGPGSEIGDIALAMFYSMYSYTGFEQPFYVLGEVKQPRRYFVKYVLLALATVMVLFPLTNIGYLCVVPYSANVDVPINMALAFFDQIARGDNRTMDTTSSQRGVTAILALFIFGTIMTQTFTGSRVKQEIGKEAIIPFFRSISRGSDSLLARWLDPTSLRNRQMNTNFIEDHPEQVPIAATALHLIFAVLLVVVTGAAAPPSMAYRILTYLRVFSIVVVLGFLTMLGLAYLKIDSWIHGVHSGSRPRHNNVGQGTAAVDGFHMQQQGQLQIDEGNIGGQKRGRRWLEKRQWWPWLDPLPTFVGCAALLFLAVATFVSPTQIRGNERYLPPYVQPLVGLLIPFLGVAWFAGLRLWQWKTRLVWVVHRLPDLRVIESERVWKTEVIEFEQLNIEEARSLQHEY